MDMVNSSALRLTSPPGFHVRYAAAVPPARP
eukprot:COSAG01_NODE_66938_length_268_cov_1.201183_1_plen_30_part_10